MSRNKIQSTAAKAGPRPTAPPAFVPTQRDFILAVLRQAGQSGISKREFREGTHPLLCGRKIAQPDSRICELEDKGYIFEHRHNPDSVVYVLASEPIGEVERSTPPETRKPVTLRQSSSASIDANGQQGLFQSFMSWETGRSHR